jgi:hypothetical protein
MDLPVCVEPEGDARAAEDPADRVRRLDFEFVFLIGWWVPDRDQQFVAGDRWRWRSSKGRGNPQFELRRLGFRL